MRKLPHLKKETEPVTICQSRLPIDHMDASKLASTKRVPPTALSSGGLGAISTVAERFPIDLLLKSTVQLSVPIITYGGDYFILGYIYDSTE
jgi:hypothetical protein